MSYAIIGFGKIGQALAKAFARKGIEVSVTTTRDPKSFASDAAAIGGVAELEGKDDRRRDQCLRRAP